jgi:hypothetical protein
MSLTRFGALKITAAPPMMSWPWKASVPPISCSGSALSEMLIARSPAMAVVTFN